MGNSQQIAKKEGRGGQAGCEGWRNHVHQHHRYCRSDIVFTWIWSSLGGDLPQPEKEQQLTV